MKTASIKLALNKGHTVIRYGVTPAEAAMYIAEHHTNVGTNPVTLLEEGEDVERTPVQERNRLTSIFGKAKVTAMFPGGSPNLPKDFPEAQEIGLGTAMPEQEFVNGNAPAAPGAAPVGGPKNDE